MRLASFRVGTSETYGIVVDDRVLNLRTAPMGNGGSFRAPRTLVEFLGEGASALEQAHEVADAFAAGGDPYDQSEPLSSVELLAPVLRPPKMLFVGRNYPEHAEETAPTYPATFPKFACNIVGPGAPVELPDLSQKVDFEAELALVIGKLGRNVGVEDALGYVAGYTIANDISARDFHVEARHLLLGKNFRTFAPLGPWLVTTDEVRDPDNLTLRLWLNDELMQDGNTRDMLFSVAEIVSVLSRFMDLEPGDVVSTGTPSGVGYFRDPPVLLKHGDEMRIELEGIGALANPVVGA
jgi:2-keto-4-pentenoate hydratase/2-oxohepta-3-ene-1,7-dioic acid hydratase in catechol pathway